MRWGWLYNGKGKGGMDRFHPKKFFVGCYEIYKALDQSIRYITQRNSKKTNGFVNT